MPAASKDEPVRLTEDATGDRVLIYGTDRGVKVELRYAGETLWATQDQMAEMFGVDRTSITKHLKNIYDEGELDKAATCEETSQVRQEGTRRVARTRPIYNLNAVISVGYRVSSKQGTLFRIFDAKRRAERHADADTHIVDLLKKERELPKARRKKSRNDIE